MTTENFLKENDNNNSTCIDLFGAYYTTIYIDHQCYRNWISIQNFRTQIEMVATCKLEGIQRNENSFCWYGKIEKAVFLQVNH